MANVSEFVTLFSIIVGLLLFLQRVLYILGPFIVLRNIKFQLYPTIETFDPESTKYPLIARKHFEESQSQLEELEFHPIAWMLLPETIPKLSTITILFHKPSHCEFAMASIIFAQNSMIGMQTLSYVEFHVEFSSGIEVNVLNSSMIGTFTAPEHVLKYQFPGNRDLKFLHNVFEKIADKTGHFRQRVDPLATKHHGDPVEMVRQGMLKEMNREVERGWMYVDQHAGQYRLNIFGAFRGAWQELFPLKQIRLAANRKRNHQLLDELGISEFA